MKNARHLKGSTQRCPKCASSAVFVSVGMTFKGYGPDLATCRNCDTVWEPFDPGQIWDPTDPVCSFREPCNNCAFRPGSEEQQDREKWIELIGNLRQGSSFYCHKGVPIEPNAEHGFAYPKDRGKLRLCRGYLNALNGLHKGAFKESEEHQEPAEGDLLG